MKITTRIEAKKFKNYFSKLFRFIGERLFLNFLLVVVLAIIIGGFIMYRYVFLSENIQFNIVERPVFFDEVIYKKVLEEWEKRDKEFQEIESKQYLNPFLPQNLPPVPGI